MTKNDYIERLVGFSKLEKNWNGYGCEPISTQAIMRSFGILSWLDATGILNSNISIAIFPVPTGGIQFEFNFNGKDSELEILKNGEMEFVLFDDNSDILFEENFDDISKISDYLTQMFS